jgi:hypothetical protein
MRIWYITHRRNSAGAFLYVTTNKTRRIRTKAALAALSWIETVTDRRYTLLIVHPREREVTKDQIEQVARVVWHNQRLGDSTLHDRVIYRDERGQEHDLTPAGGGSVQATGG